MILSNQTDQHHDLLKIKVSKWREDKAIERIVIKK